MTRLRFLLPVLLLAPVLAFAQLDTAWLRVHDLGEEDEDWVSDMVVDQQGNIYLCGMGFVGNGSEDIVLEKWTPDGTLEWRRVHDGEEADEDSAAAMVLDAAGNVYLCGWSYMDPVRGMDMFTIKYSPSGDSLWQKTFGRPGPGDDAALDICLADPTTVVVTGYSTDSTGPFNIDFCTYAYNADNGDSLWVQFYNRTPEDDEDVAVAICADPSGNVYVTGYSYDDGTDYDIVTIKYEPGGNRAWTKRYNRQGDDDYGVDVAYNTVTNSISVGAIIYTDNHDYDYYTIAYSAAGDSMWAREYNRYPANDEDLLMAVAVDDQGNTYVTGTSWDETTDYDCATVSYDPTGLQRWVARYDKNGWEDSGLRLAVDSLRNVFTVGYAEGVDTDYDALVVKVSEDGSIVWGWTYDNVEYEDYGTRVLPQGDGTILVAGTSEGDTTDYDFLLARLIELVADFHVSAILAPESLMVGESLVPAIVVKNEAAVLGDGWAWFRATWTDHADSIMVHLEPGQLDTFEFATWYPESVGVFDLAGWTMLPGDQRPGNDSAFATLVVWGDTTGVGEGGIASLAAGYRVYPNPARGLVNVRAMLPGAARADVRLYDVTGSLVRAEPLVRSASGSAAAQLDIRRFAAGIYFCRLQHDGGEVTRKLVIQR